jgi:hypothetical protein
MATVLELIDAEIEAFYSNVETGSLDDKSPSIKSSRLTLETCFALLAAFEPRATRPEGQTLRPCGSSAVASECVADYASIRLYPVLLGSERFHWI